MTLVMSLEIETESSLNFLCPHWLWERSDITAFGESRFSKKPGDLSSFLTRGLHCPFVKMLIPNVCLIKAGSCGMGPACQTEAGAKPQWQVRSAVWLVFSVKCCAIVCICQSVCVALALFAWYLQQSVTFWLETVCENQMQNSLIQSIFEIRNK